jgi:acyl-coenzyme A synthetase/AMP-(fatty) acid ligase/3-hydroxymyristoyl/3-hydroxydecanoyl-(acyl carrier protein) dehydratase
MTAFRLPEPGTPRAPVAMGPAGEVGLDAFYAAAGAVAEVVEGRAGDVLVACHDRLHLAAAVVGSWMAGRTVTFAPPQSPARAAELLAMGGVGLVLGDEPGPGVVVVADLPPRPPAGAPSFDEDRIAARLYTGGSTGVPVAHPKTFAQLVGEAVLLGRLFDLGGARVLPTVPPHHIYGLLMGVLAPLWGGGTFARETPTNPARIAACAAELGADLLVAVPPHLKALADSSERPASLRRAFSSGGALHAGVAARLRAGTGMAVTELFGSTETGGIGHRQSDVTDVWTVFPGVEVRANPDAALVLRSPFAGPDPAVGADRIELVGPDRFRHLGRLDGVVKVGGARVSLLDLQHRIAAFPGVEDVAVIGLPAPAPRDTEICCALVAPAVPTTELRRELRRWFDPVVLPRRWRFLSALPRDATGKLPQQAVRALFQPEGGADALTTFETRTHRREREGDVERHTFEVFVPADAWYFRGHFPGDPILPGVAQLNELIMPHVARAWPSSGRPRRLSRVKFQRPIRPKDLIGLALERGGAGGLRFTLRVLQEAVASGTIELEGGA